MWPVAEIPGIATVPAANAANAQNGAVVGGVLRPGAIDQGQFQKLLQAQYQAQNRGKAVEAPKGMTLTDYRKLAGMPLAASAAVPTANSPALAPTSPAPKPTQAAGSGDGIPTLSLEQFAALTGLTLPESSPPALSTDAAPGQIRVALTTSPVETADMGPLDMPEPPAAEAPAESVDGVPVDVPAPEVGAEAAAQETAEEPAQKTNSRVVLLDSVPDREEQHRIAAQGKTWSLKETPGARELFLGPDGKFGWDDFVDIINPLQHIPVVSQIYRAVTGDQAYGLSAFIGAAPFGALSLASAVVDTVIRAQTGRDAGTDMAARIFGIDNRTPEEADLHLGRASEPQLAATGSAGTVQVADARVQQQDTNSAWTRDGAGIARD